MENVQKKKRRTRSPLVWLAIVWVALMGIIGARALLLSRPEAPLPQAMSTVTTILQRGPEEVASITIRRGSSPEWTAVQEESGLLTVQGEDGFTLTSTDSALLLEAAAFLQAEDVLSENPEEYANLADFGLDDPRYAARIAYTDGLTIDVQVGYHGAEGAWRYMTISGDDRLFAFANGSVERLFPNRDTLREVTQPTLHKARIDGITFTGPEGVQAAWALTGPITASDAIDRWVITAPITYPADSTAMSNLLTNLANLRLGAWVCEATPENLTACGFDEPRLTIDIHMAAGTIGNVNSEGVYVTADWPAGTTTYVIGGEKSDMVDYVLHDGGIYISSHFTVGLFINYDVTPTMSRYLLPTALGNLSSLAIEKNGETALYAITRTEQVAENNDLLTDVDGSLLYDITLTKDGKAADYAAFEAAYTALLPVTVSGMLPAPVDAAPHTVYTFTDVDGTVHTVAFITFDVMHDAVEVDGHQAFYLIKGGFDLGL